MMVLPWDLEPGDFRSLEPSAGTDDGSGCNPEIQCGPWMLLQLRRLRLSSTQGVDDPAPESPTGIPDLLWFVVGFGVAALRATP